MRLLTILLAAAVALAPAIAPAAPQAQTYDLTVRPKFQAGQCVRIQRSQKLSMEWVGAAGKVLESNEQSLSATLRQTILAVDAADMPTELAITVVSADKTVKIARNNPDAQTTRTVLDDLHATAARTDGAFVADMQSLCSDQTESLSPAQVALVKALLRRDLSFAGYDAANALLLPPSPLAVGQSWTPSAQALEAWVKASPSLRRAGGTASSAELRLASVKDGVATLHGAVRMGATLGDQKIAATVTVLLRIDTATGRWVTRISQLNAKIPHPGGGVQKLALEREEFITFVPPQPSVTTASAPSCRHKLGWENPAKDAGAWQDAAAGLSLSVPKAFTQDAGDNAPRPPMVASFRTDGASISITQTALQELMELDQLARMSEANLKRSAEGYVTTQRREVALVDNVPAVLLIGKAYDNKAVIITLLATDGERAVSVNAAASADDQPRIDELLRVVQTLRIAEPQ